MAYDEEREHREDGHYIEVHCEYFQIEPDENGEEPEWTVGRINTHFHGVPPNMIADTLLMIARDVVQESMSDQMFNEAVPAEVRAVAARVMATQYLASRINSPDLMNMETTSARVPDDISSLLEAEG